MVVIINNKSLTDIKAEYVAEVSPKNVILLPTNLKEPDWETIAFQRKLLRDEIRKLYALLRKIILEPDHNLTKEVKEKTIPALVGNIVGAYTNFVNTLHKYEAVEYLLSQILQTVIGEKYPAYPLKKGMLYLSKHGMKKPKKYSFYNISYAYQQGDDLSTVLVGDLYLSARIKGLESMLLKVLKGYRSFNDMLGIKLIFNGWDDEAVQLIGYEINERLLELGFKSLPRSSVKIERGNKKGEVFPVIYQSEREKVLVLYANDYEMVRPGYNRREIKRKKLKGKNSHDMILYSIKNEPHKPQEYWLDLGNNKGMLITLLEYENKDVLLENIMCLVSRYLQEKEHLNKESSFEISYKDIELIPWGYWYANNFER
ncbi:MAG: hypothetical protein GXN99_00735, partial [Candidatus Nanohaloarchaeota archaeon]|nr:hypothetical protein [Candidatus Nanohaloarchaeota archaeon]